MLLYFGVNFTVEQAPVGSELGKTDVLLANLKGYYLSTVQLIMCFYYIPANPPSQVEGVM